MTETESLERIRQIIADAEVRDQYAVAVRCHDLKILLALAEIGMEVDAPPMAG